MIPESVPLNSNHNKYTKYMSSEEIADREVELCIFQQDADDIEID